MAAKRDARGKFLKGSSGHPGGGRAMTPEVKKLFIDLTPTAVRKLKAFVEKGTPLHQLRAIEIILDRSLGRNPKPIVPDAPGGDNANLKALEAEAVTRALEGSDVMLALLLKAMDPKKYGPPDEGGGAPRERTRLNFVGMGEARADHKPASDDAPEKPEPDDAA